MNGMALDALLFGAVGANVGELGLGLRLGLGLGLGLHRRVDQPSHGVRGVTRVRVRVRVKDP